MKDSPRIRTWFVGAVALLGAAIGGIYSVQLLTIFADPPSDPIARQVVISAIAAQAGWVVLMLWVLLEPLRRYEVLLFMAVPMMLANVLNGADAYLRADAGVREIAANSLGGLLVVAVFASAFVVGRSGGVATGGSEP